MLFGTGAEVTAKRFFLKITPDLLFRTFSVNGYGIVGPMGSLVKGVDSAPRLLVEFFYT